MWISVVEGYSASSMKLTFSDSAISSCRLTPWPLIFVCLGHAQNCFLNQDRVHFAFLVSNQEFKSMSSSLSSVLQRQAQGCLPQPNADLKLH